MAVPLREESPWLVTLPAGWPDRIYESYIGSVDLRMANITADAEELRLREECRKLKQVVSHFESVNPVEDMEIICSPNPIPS